MTFVKVIGRASCRDVSYLVVLEMIEYGNLFVTSSPTRRGEDLQAEMHRKCQRRNLLKWIELKQRGSMTSCGRTAHRGNLSLGKEPVTQNIERKGEQMGK